MCNKTKQKEKAFLHELFIDSALAMKNWWLLFVEINTKEGVWMPEEGSKVQFGNYRKQLLTPFVIL